MRKNIDFRVNRIIWSLFINGGLLLILALLVVWSPLLARLSIGVVILIVGAIFIYLGYRIWDFKKHLEKFLK